MLPDFSSLCQEPRAGLRYALTSGSELPGSKWEKRSVKQRDGNLAGARNYNIYFQYWEPDESARAVILVVHGAGEHSARYARFAEYFAARGYTVAALDHPNHGRSDGTYGHVERFDDFLQTLRLFHRQVSEDFAGLPVFLLGHSMGGLISSLYLLEHQAEFVGCVLSGPAIKTDIEPPWIQLQLIRLFSAVLPRLGVLQLDANGVSRDPAEVDKYVNDPLVNHSKMTARKVAELFRAGSELVRITVNNDEAAAAVPGIVARLRDVGIDVPIVPGVLPINKFAQAERFATMCGASVPDWLRMPPPRSAVLSLMNELGTSGMVKPLPPLSRAVLPETSNWRAST